MTQYLLSKTDSDSDDIRLGLTSDSFNYGGVLGGDNYRASEISHSAYLELDESTSDYVAIDSKLESSTLSGLTVMSWIRSTDTGGEAIISSYDRSEYYRLNLANGNLDCSFDTSGGGGDHNSGEFVADGLWHHVAAVYDAGTVRMYVDGQRVFTDTGYASEIGSGGARYGFIGTGSEAEAFDGSEGPNSYGNLNVSDHRLYTDAKTDAEIKDAFEGNPPTVNLHEYLPLNTDDSGRLNDNSGNDRHGYLRNSASVYGSDAPFTFEDAEDADFSDWTVNQGTLSASTNSAIGAYSMFHDNFGGDDGAREAVKSLTNPRQVDSFSFMFWEKSSNTSSALSFYNSNGNREFSVGTDNPAWAYDDPSGTANFGNPQNYKSWMRFSISFDWVENTYTVVGEELATGYTKSRTGDLYHGVDIAEVASGQVSLSGYTGAGSWYLDEMYIDPLVTTNSDTFTQNVSTFSSSTLVINSQNATFADQTTPSFSQTTPNAVRSSTGAGTVVTEVFPNRNKEDFRGSWGGEIEYYEWDGVRGLENTYENYSQRVRGYLIPPETGTYYFWICADNTGDLWLDDTQILDLNDWTGFKDWTKYPDQQKSDPIELTAGVPVKFEAYMYEISGGDNLGIGWRKPSDGDGSAPVGLVPAEHFQSAVGGRSTTTSLTSTAFSNALQDAFTSSTFANSSSDTTAGGLAELFTHADQSADLDTSSVVEAFTESFDTVERTGLSDALTGVTGDTTVATTQTTTSLGNALAEPLVASQRASITTDDASSFTDAYVNALEAAGSSLPTVASGSTAVTSLGVVEDADAIPQFDNALVELFAFVTPETAAAAPTTGTFDSQADVIALTENATLVPITPTMDVVIQVRSGQLGVEGQFADSLAASVGAATNIKVAKTTSNADTFVGSGTTSTTPDALTAALGSIGQTTTEFTQTTASGLLAAALLESVVSVFTESTSVGELLATSGTTLLTESTASATDTSAVKSAALSSLDSNGVSSVTPTALAETAQAVMRNGIADTKSEAAALVASVVASRLRSNINTSATTVGSTYSFDVVNRVGIADSSSVATGNKAVYSPSIVSGSLFSKALPVIKPLLVSTLSTSGGAETSAVSAADIAELNVDAVQAFLVLLFSSQTGVTTVDLVQNQSTNVADSKNHVRIISNE